MEFFSKLIAIGNVDLSLRMMQKNDKITIEVMPGSAKSTGVKPMLITGTGPELDANFFDTILPKVAEITGLQHNLDSVKEQTVEKLADEKADSEKAAAKKEEAKKPAKPGKAEKQKPASKAEEPATPPDKPVVEAPEQPDMFSTGLLS